MRVLQVVDSLRRGGAETLVVDLCEELATRAGVVPSLLVVDPDRADPGLLARARTSCARVGHAGGPALSDVRLPARLVRASAGADVVHTHLVFAAVGTRVARLVRRRPADVCTVHTAPGPEAHGTRLRTQADLRTAWLSARLVAPSAGIAEAHRAACSPRPRRIDVVPNGARPRAVTAGANPRALRGLLGVRDDALLVLAVARLDPGKGIADLVRAVAAVPRAVVVVAGDGPERAALETLAASTGVADRVRLLGHRDDIGDLLAAADAFCLPSHHEALPISVLEAMHAGVAVLGTTVGAVPELLDDGRAGLLVAPHDVAGLAAALERLADPAARATLAAAGQARAVARHSIGAMADAYLAVYEELAA